MQHGPGWCPGRRLRGSYLDQVSVYHGGPDLQGPGRSRRVTRADLALAFAAEGWRVLALHAARDGICTCPKAAACDRPGKHPCFDRDLQPKGSLSASRDADHIRALWDRWPEANIGGVAGDGLAVLDFDPRNYTDDSHRWLTEHRDRLPPTRTHATGGGGEHLVFGSAGRLPFVAVLAPGIELLGHGHIVVLPGSVHVSGQTYDITDSRAHADMPAWLANLARTRPATPA